MEMHQIRYFLAVANELNFTRAAEKCNVTQPSLTRAIKLLEDELGGLLFHRERDNTHLTDLGRAIRPNFEHILADTTNVKRTARDLTTLKKAILKLGVMCTIAPHLLIELLADLRAHNPGIEIELIDASAREINDLLIEGGLDIAIYCLPPDETDYRLNLIPLFKEQMVIVVHPDHPLAQRNAIRARDLDGQSYLSRINCEFRGYAGDVLRELGISFQTAYRSERDDWIQAMIATGLGFGFLPQGCVTYRGVVARPLVDPEFWREVNLVTVRGRPHSPVVSALTREAQRVKWRGGTFPTG
jgi:LysR family transcriptional regulator, hydrogen peroxide-inducible genes activator